MISYISFRDLAFVNSLVSWCKCFTEGKASQPNSHFRKLNPFFGKPQISWEAIWTPLSSRITSLVRCPEAPFRRLWGGSGRRYCALPCRRKVLVRSRTTGVWWRRIWQHLFCFRKRQMVKHQKPQARHRVRTEFPSSYKMGHESGLSIGGSGSFWWLIIVWENIISS